MTTIKRTMRSWIIVYFGLIAALVTAGGNGSVEEGANIVPGGSIETAIDKSYFISPSEQSRRSDI